MEIKLSNNVRKRYITQVRGNIYDSSDLRDLKLKRDWMLGKIIQDTEFIQTRNYENLIMEVNKDDNTMTRIYNDREYSRCFDEDVEENNIHKNEEKIIYLGGYKISSRFYKTYVIENNAYKDYKDLLAEAVDVIKYGCQYHSFNDKAMYKEYNSDTNTYTIVTLTDGIKITNMRWGVKHEQN